MIFRFFFVGRLNGALGRTYPIVKEVEAVSEDDALLKLYETHEHIWVEKVEKSCTCGSGGHPRRCEIHPEAFQQHIDELNKINEEES